MSFVEKISGAGPLSFKILQVNVGLLCNKSCSHCHLKAGPIREEIMNQETMKRVIALSEKINPSLIDITGGAPEIIPNIRWFIEKIIKNNYDMQLRTNLTALLLDDSLIDFFAEKRVKLVASLPCYELAEVDSIRGDGTFDDSIRVLRMLNNVGYGISPNLELDLVFNPEADFLPPPQSTLEDTFHKRLNEDFGVDFTNLITITNMPIGRFREGLKKNGQLESYMKLLRETYNPLTLDGLMCRHQVNVNWKGDVFDCDFNQALGLPMKLNYININSPDFCVEELLLREIKYGEHCYGCTAGQGSSCSGALTR